MTIATHHPIQHIAVDMASPSFAEAMRAFEELHTKARQEYAAIAHELDMLEREISREAAP